MPGIQIITKECGHGCAHQSICTCSSHSSSSSSSCGCRVECSIAAPAVCHDVSILLDHLNALAFPSVQYTCAPHPPISCCPAEDKNLPLAFAYNSRLIRDELHHNLLAYLAEGVHPSLFTDGSAGAKILTARQLIAVDRLDGYHALQCIVYGTLLLSINAALLEDTPRNKCLDGQRLWTVTSPPCGGHSASLECRVGGSSAVVLDLHPTTVVSNELMDAILAVVKIGTAYDSSRGRVICEKSTDSCLHYDALALLGQVWTRFAKDAYRKEPMVRFVVLSNLERSIVFHRKTGEIAVSHAIHRDGLSTPRDSVQNLYSLILALSVLEKHQYSHPALVDLL